MSKINYIIGDNVGAFGNLENVFTYSQILKMVSNDKSLRSYHYVIGQGINSEEREQLEKLSRENLLGMIINAYQRPATGGLTHKKKNENIIISEPLLVSLNKSYRSYLVIDDSCAEMSDHVTGLHIQGMVLTEAARQMMLAVAEKFILQPCERGNSYCVLTRVSSEFFQFAFPVDITIEHEIIDLIAPKGKGYEVKSRTFFVQNNTVIAHVDIDYKFHNKRVLELIESKMAVRTLRSNMAYQVANMYLESVA